MKQIPKLPYMENLFRHYRFNHGTVFSRGSTGIKQYHDWIKQFGFKVPVRGDYLEFPDDFSDEKLMVFMLRWA